MKENKNNRLAYKNWFRSLENGENLTQKEIGPYRRPIDRLSHDKDFMEFYNHNTGNVDVESIINILPNISLQKILSLFTKPHTTIGIQRVLSLVYGKENNKFVEAEKFAHLASQIRCEEFDLNTTLGELIRDFDPSIIHEGS